MKYETISKNIERERERESVREMKRERRIVFNSMAKYGGNDAHGAWMPVSQFSLFALHTHTHRQLLVAE